MWALSLHSSCFTSFSCICFPRVLGGGPFTLGKVDLAPVLQCDPLVRVTSKAGLLQASSQSQLPSPQTATLQSSHHTWKTKPCFSTHGQGSCNEQPKVLLTHERELWSVLWWGHNKERTGRPPKMRLGSSLPPSSQAVKPHYRILTNTSLQGTAQPHVGMGTLLANHNSGCIPCSLSCPDVVKAGWCFTRFLYLS